MGKIVRYNDLNDELRLLLFDIEKYFGEEVGSGRVFKDRAVDNSISEIKQVFTFIAKVYLGYTGTQVKNCMNYKYLSNVSYAINRIGGLLEFNRPLRNRLYNIAIDNSIMGLVYDIIDIIDNKKVVVWGEK